MPYVLPALSRGRHRPDPSPPIEGAHAAVTASLGPVIGVILAVGLLASGLASTSVGCSAGGSIMQGLLKIRIAAVISVILLVSLNLVLLWLTISGAA